MPDRHGAVTGTMLRDIVLCERRAWHDVHTPDELRAPTSSFVELLWAEGVSHESRVLASLDDVIDLRREPLATRRCATMAALARGTATHILGAEIALDGLVGRPDLISRIDGRWIVGDVKAGTPFMPDGRRPKDVYAVQIGLYAFVMAELGHGDGGRAFLIGADGERVVFDLDAPWGRSSVRQMTLNAVQRACEIQEGVAATRGEASAKCGLCHWRDVCRGELERADDLTLVAELGRKARRDVEAVAPSRTDLAHFDVGAVTVAGNRTEVPGVGADRLHRFQDRARLQLTPGARAYAREPLGLSRAPLEWHLDIEADPTRGGFVYLHGVWERVLTPERVSGRFVYFFAADQADEREVFAAAWAFLNSDPTACIFYYSRYERTAYRALQKRHPDVCTAEEVEAFFADERVVDLYTDVVRPKTEWPLSSYGIKPIAKSLGFSWNAEDASGASSIAWYDEYARTSDPELRARIIDYNRSDCQASAVVLDALIALPVGAPPWPPAGSVDDLAVQVVEAGGAGARPDGGSASEADRADATWRAEGEELRGFFEDLRAGHGGSEGREKADRLAHGGGPPEEGTRVEFKGAGSVSRSRAATSCYSSPSLRPCVSIEPEARDGSAAFVGLERLYAPLVEELPLLGGEALRPELDGGLRLCAALRSSMPWLEGAIAALERQLRIALWAGRPWLQFRPLCLVGGVGVGKSHFAHRVATLAGAPTAALDLGAMHDAAALVAVSRGWSSVKPCWPAQMMSVHRCANPVLVLDELEKAGGSRRNGDPLTALLGMTEAETARRHYDTALMTEVDLSAICWIATANDAARIPAPLASRFEIVEVKGPSPDHFDLVLDGLLANQERRWALSSGMLPPLPPGARSTLRDAFARTRSLRALRRHVEMVLAALLAGADRPVH